VVNRPCHTCPDGIATVCMWLGAVRDGKAFWVCSACAAMFEQLARALGGRPRREPVLRRVK
jgi:hypothetical protein